MILKWLIFGVIVYAVYILFFKEKNIASKDSKSFKKDDNDSEEMVECCECGTFISSKEAFIKNGKFYCSKECMTKG